MGDREEDEGVPVVEGGFESLEVADLDAVEEDECGDGGAGDWVEEGVSEGLPVDVDEGAEGLVDVSGLGNGDGRLVLPGGVLGDPQHLDGDLGHSHVLTGSQCINLRRLGGMLGGSVEVEVRYYAMLRDAAGRRSEELDLPEGSSFGDLMDVVVEKYGAVFRRYVFDDGGRERDYLSFMVNGVSVHSREGFDTPLADGDVVAILPPVGGG